MKNFIRKIVGIVCISLLCLSFCACDDEEKSTTFDFYVAKSEMESADSYVRAYLNNLQLNNPSNSQLSGHVSIAKDSFSSALSVVQTCSSIVNSISSLGEEDQDIKDSLQQSNTKFSIVYEGTDIVLDFSEDRKFLSIKTENKSNFMLVEYAKLDEGKYACQIVIKNFESNEYDIMQLMFNGFSGSFVVDNFATQYASIYLADITADNFPLTNGDVKYSF